ncbi:hypothetical protein RXV86_06505 [Alisedimentitalea sp. MJ-SS2]|nr:hypothetical protein [Alisedimentitalea sp. MJ-SS2]
MQNQNLGGFPYSPLIYNLDLSVLAYQLYSQTLIWPFDPYYEEFAQGDVNRGQIMNKVRGWARAVGRSQQRTRPPLGGYRGPGRLAGFDDNPRSDPIIYRYDQLYPWRSTLFNPAGRWTEYTPPKEIVGRIRDAYMCYRKTGRPEGDVAVNRVVTKQAAANQGARDILLAFEGATGDKGEPGQPASQSLMGFVLLRFLPGSNKYDAHIVFRGSRSGSAFRAAVKANFTKTASGNPDWVTDLGWFRIGPDEGAAAITTVGTVHRGFAKSMIQTLPQVFACLDRGASLTGGAAPRNIYVTGHSLGGGLAQHFVSAVLLGNQYGPNGAGPSMPNRLRSWPWAATKMISFSAPRAGDELWAATLTEKSLQSVAFNTAFWPVDVRALTAHDPSILPRLVNPSRPAGYRVLVSNDPITTEKVVGGKHVGKTIYANKLGSLAPFAVAKAESHDPGFVRSLLAKTLNDQRTPPTPLRYHDMAVINPTLDRSERASATAFKKLHAVLARYYARGNPPAKTTRLEKDFGVFLSMLPILNAN